MLGGYVETRANDGDGNVVSRGESVSNNSREMALGVDKNIESLGEWGYNLVGQELSYGEKRIAGMYM